MLGQQRAHRGEDMLAVALLLARTTAVPSSLRIIMKVDLVMMPIPYLGRVGNARLLRGQVPHVAVAEGVVASAARARGQIFEKMLRCLRVEQCKTVVHRFIIAGSSFIRQVGG